MVDAIGRLENDCPDVVYPPPVRTNGTALPVSTGKSVEREVDLQLQGLVIWGKGWQPDHVAEKRPPFTDEVTDRRESGTKGDSVSVTLPLRNQKHNF